MFTRYIPLLPNDRSIEPILTSQNNRSFYVFSMNREHGFITIA